MAIVISSSLHIISYYRNNEICMLVKLLYIRKSFQSFWTTSDGYLQEQNCKSVYTLNVIVTLEMFSFSMVKFSSNIFLHLYIYQPVLLQKLESDFFRYYKQDKLLGVALRFVIEYHTSKCGSHF